MTTQLSELSITFSLRDPFKETLDEEGKPKRKRGKPKEQPKEEDLVKTPVLIYMNVRCWEDNQRLVYPIKRKILPKDWDFLKSMPKRGKDPELFSTLNNLRSIANNLYYQFVRQFEKIPSVVEFRDILINETIPQGGLYNLWEAICDEKKNPNTSIGYHQSRTVFMKRWPSLKYGEVTKAFMEKAAAKLEKDYSRNTVGKHLNRIREVMGQANDEGLTSNTSYRGFTYESEKIKAVALSQHELELIRTYEMPSEHLDNARDLFLVGCWTGLRYSDYSRLTADNIVENGKKRIKIKTSKTGKTVVIPVLPALQSILDKREGQFPRMITNQKLNKYIKDAVKLIPEFQMDFRVERTAGANTTVDYSPKWELIGTHVGRRSFCTNSYELGIPVVDIMAISGHSKESTFFTYIQKDPEASADALEAGWTANLNNDSTLRVAK